MTDLEVMPRDEPEIDNRQKVQAVIDAARRVVADIRVSERTGKWNEILSRSEAAE